MKLILYSLCLVLCLAHPPKLVEIAKKVNSMGTTWIANEAIPTRDYKQYLGALKGGVKIPIKSIKVREDLPES